MKLLTISIVLLICLPVCADDDLRNKVRGEAHKISKTIDPGKHIYGHAFGTTEEEFIKTEGKPDGYFKLSGGRTVMVYGRSHGYIFTHSKLTGVRITSQIIDWKLANQMPYQQKRSEDDWIISNGVHAKMSKEKLTKLLGDKLNTKHFQTSFEIGGCVVEVNFIRYSTDNDEGREEIGGVYIHQKQG